MAGEPTPLLDAFLAFWAGAQLAGDAIARGQTTAIQALQPWTGRLALIERTADARHRFIMVGAKLLPRFGETVANRLFDEIDPNALGDLETRVTRAFRTGAPMSAKIALPHLAHAYVEILIPLSGEEGENLLLLAAYPEGCDPERAH
ncbi:MAG TPA: hypothetical protein VGM26_17465 [Rhizomicrobium sp.]|jgi:hypothetical protein